MEPIKRVRMQELARVIQARADFELASLGNVPEDLDYEKDIKFAIERTMVYLKLRSVAEAIEIWLIFHGDPTHTCPTCEGGGR